MIDVSDILNDADVCSSFTIQRQTGVFALGGFTLNPPQTIPAFGAVRNTSGKELDMVPEGDRNKELLTFRSVTQMFETNAQNSQVSDVLIWPAVGGDQYSVLAVKNYSEQGQWYAVATRTEGD